MKRHVAGLLAVMIAAGCASHRPPPHGGPPWGDRDRGEHRGPHGPQLFISPSGKPFRAGPEAAYPVAAWFAEADRDHDGQVTAAEFRADAEAFFAVVDADHSGDIDMNETAVYERVIVPEIIADPGGGARGFPGGDGPRGGRHGRGGGGRRGQGSSQGAAAPAFDGLLAGAARYSLINEAHPIRGADSDFSMTVSKAEWRAATDRRFKLLDKDGDGVLRLADLPRTAAQGRADRVVAGRRRSG